MNDSPAPPKPNEKLVRVFDTEQESEALVVRGLLDSSGIDCDITSLDAQQDILPGVGGTMAMTWVPERAGNWLMHCHLRAHSGPDSTWGLSDVAGTGAYG